MRGFFSFLLGLAILSAILFSASAYSSARASGRADLLVLEKRYYYEGGVKHALLDTAKYAAQEARDEYLLEAATSAASGGQIPPPNDTIEERIRGRVHEKLASFEIPDEEKGEWDFVLWCGETSDQDMKDTAADSARNETTGQCPTCHIFSDEECEHYVNVNALTSELWLGAAQPPEWGTDSVVGFTLYNRKHGFASTAFIPKSRKVNY